MLSKIYDTELGLVCLFIYLLFILLHGLYRTLSHSQSEESQVQGGHKSVSENPAIKFSRLLRHPAMKWSGFIFTTPEPARVVKALKITAMKHYEQQSTGDLQ